MSGLTYAEDYFPAFSENVVDARLWDGTTTLSYNGAEYPACAEDEEIPVCGPGTFYCVKLTLDQLTRLLWKPLKVSVNIKDFAPSPNATGSMSLSMGWSWGSPAEILTGSTSLTATASTGVIPDYSAVAPSQANIDDTGSPWSNHKKLSKRVVPDTSYGIVGDIFDTALEYGNPNLYDPDSDPVVTDPFLQKCRQEANRREHYGYDVNPPGSAYESTSWDWIIQSSDTPPEKLVGVRLGVSYFASCFALENPTSAFFSDGLIDEYTYEPPYWHVNVPVIKDGFSFEVASIILGNLIMRIPSDYSDSGVDEYYIGALTECDCSYEMTLLHWENQHHIFYGYVRHRISYRYAATTSSVLYGKVKRPGTNNHLYRYRQYNTTGRVGADVSIVKYKLKISPDDPWIEADLPVGYDETGSRSISESYPSGVYVNVDFSTGFAASAVLVVVENEITDTIQVPEV